MNKRAQLKTDRCAVAMVAGKLEALGEMTVGELVEKYREVFGVPTRTRNKDYLRKKIAWRIQELAEGGLSPRALSKIEELAPLAPVRWHHLQTSDRPPLTLVSTPTLPHRDRDPRLPPPGTQLMRIHGGVEHRVTVLEQGFEYQGKYYKALSPIAKLITGSPWSGFVFFNLQERKARLPVEEDCK